MKLTQHILTAVGHSYSKRYLDTKLHDTQKQLGNKFTNLLKKNI